MTRTIAAILALSPVLLHAQTKSPAQPGSTPILQARLVRPAAPSPIPSPAVEKAATATPLRISTGVTPPHRISGPEINPSRTILIQNSRGDHTVVIEMVVDETGKPVNLKVTRSIDQFTDQGVLDAVSQYRYKPAMLDGVPVATRMELSYAIQ